MTQSNGSAESHTSTREKEESSQNQNHNVTSGNERRETKSTSATGMSSMSQKIEEHRKRAEEQFEKSTADILERESRRDRDEFGHSRLFRMFDPHFQAFPEFDPVPFWKRGKTSSLLDEMSGNSKKTTSLLDEFSCRKKASSLLDELDLKNGGLLSDSSASAELQSDRDNFKVIKTYTYMYIRYYIIIRSKALMRIVKLANGHGLMM